MTDVNYCAERNKLIPEAEAHAHGVAGPRPPGCGDEWAAVWNKAFFRKMDELWREHVDMEGRKRG